MRFAFIEAEKAKYDVALLCEVLEVSRQGYYAWRARKPCRHKLTDEVLRRSIHRAFAESGARYGAPRVQQALRAQGQATSRKRVARLMRQEGLVGRNRRRRFIRTTDSRHGHAVAPNLVNRASRRTGPIGSGRQTSPTSPPRRAGSTWRSYWTCSAARSWAGPCSPTWTGVWSWPLS